MLPHGATARGWVTSVEERKRINLYFTLLCGCLWNISFNKEPCSCTPLFQPVWSSNKRSSCVKHISFSRLKVLGQTDYHLLQWLTVLTALICWGSARVSWSTLCLELRSGGLWCSSWFFSTRCGAAAISYKAFDVENPFLPHILLALICLFSAGSCFLSVSASSSAPSNCICRCGVCASSSSWSFLSFPSSLSFPFFWSLSDSLSFKNGFLTAMA